MITAAAIAVVLGCSFGWSLLDLTRKSLVEKIPALPLLFFVTAGMIPLFAAWVVLDDPATFQPGYLLPATISILLNIAANLAFFEAIRVSPLSITIPLLSFTPVFATVLAVPLLGEVPTGMQALGIALVVVGAFVLNLVAGDSVSVGTIWKAFTRERGVPLMLLVAFLWAATIAFDKMAVERSSGALHGLVLSAGIGLAALAALAGARRTAELKTAGRAPWTLMAALVIGAVALSLQLEAIQMVWVGAVETVKRSLGNVMAVIFGRLFFGESVTPQKVVAVLLMALGVALLLGMVGFLFP